MFLVSVKGMWVDIGVDMNVAARCDTGSSVWVRRVLACSEV